MSTDSLLPPRPPSAARPARVEFLDFADVAEHREFRFRVSGPDGSTEVRVRIAIAAFAAGRVGMQDGPDVCYGKLLRTVAAGETSADVIMIDDAELASYREARTKVPKRRSWTPTPSSPATPVFGPPRPPRTPPAPPRVAPPATIRAAPAFAEGQRVVHAVYGVGVTTSSSDAHTVVQFDQDGRKTFVTSMLELDVLSAPGTWETGPRGKNRLCRTL
jgi:hypothetical protein